MCRNITCWKIRGGFEFKCESAFFYELCVTKVIILFDICKLEAILHLLGFERTKISYFLTELWSRENRHPQNLSQFFTISDISLTLKACTCKTKEAINIPFSE